MNYSRLILKKTDGPITDFAAERNKLLEKAKEDWVLFVDSDEEVPEELNREILDLARMTQYEGYLIKRKDFFFGKWLRFGETGKIKLLRLGKKGAGKWERKVHEIWKIGETGKIGEMKNPLLHYPHQTISSFIDSINRYTDIDAKELVQEGKKFSCFRVAANPLGKFLQNYFTRLGFLDGRAGFVHAFMMAFQSLVVRVKQYDLLQTS